MSSATGLEPVRVDVKTTSAVPKREHFVRWGVSLHVVWPRTAHIPPPPTPLSCGCGVQGHTRSGANAGAGAEAMAMPCHDAPGRPGDIRELGKAGLRPVPWLALPQLVKEQGPMQKGPDPVGTGPLRTELGGCAARRCPLPDAMARQGVPADDCWPAVAIGRRIRTCPWLSSTPSWLGHARTRPDPGRVWWSGRRGSWSRGRPWLVVETLVVKRHRLNWLAAKPAR